MNLRQTRVCISGYKWGNAVSLYYDTERTNQVRVMCNVRHRQAVYGYGIGG